MLNNELSILCLRSAEQAMVDHYFTMGEDGVRAAAALITELRGVVWAATAHSQLSIAKVWNHLDSKGIDVGSITPMTNIFILLSGLRLNQVAVIEDVAYSVCWPQPIKEMGVADIGNYVTTFKQNPWAVFLYYLANSSAAALVSQAMATLPKPRPSR